MTTVRKIPAQLTSASLGKELAGNVDYTEGKCPVCGDNMIMSTIVIQGELVPAYACLEHNVVLPVSDTI